MKVLIFISIIAALSSCMKLSKPNLDVEDVCSSYFVEDYNGVIDLATFISNKMSKGEDPSLEKGDLVNKCDNIYTFYSQDAGCMAHSEEKKVYIQVSDLDSICYDVDNFDGKEKIPGKVTAP